jgi:SAM-dependent methyltransferase
MAANQTERFLGGVGDDYYIRNRNDFGKKERDPILTMMDAVDVKPTSVLEIGCANGWRLKKIKERYGCHVRGIDPSAMAIQDGQKDLGDDIQVGVGQRIPFADGSFDVVIFGYFLFLCEPDSWFQIIAEANRVLADKGHIIHYDYISARPLVWNYAPVEATLDEKDCVAWIYDHSKIWLSHPGYTAVAEGTGPCEMGKTLACQVAVIIFKKDMVRPFAKPDDAIPGLVKT